MNSWVLSYRHVTTRGIDGCNQDHKSRHKAATLANLTPQRPAQRRENGARPARIEEGMCSLYLIVGSNSWMGDVFREPRSSGSDCGSNELTFLCRFQYLDKRLFVQLNGSRKVIGVLRGYDVCYRHPLSRIPPLFVTRTLLIPRLHRSS